MFYPALLMAALLAAAGQTPRPPTAKRVIFPPQRPASLRQDLNNVPERILASHNRERLAVGAAPLIWDAQLAAGAAAYGPMLARLGRLTHSDRASRPGQSENLWMGSAGAYRVEAMVEYWAAEKSLFMPGVFPNNSRNGNWLDVSHYTTMIWPTTLRVGCAVHREGSSDFLICRYSPSANRPGVKLP